jgi:hypothetical protein
MALLTVTVNSLGILVHFFNLFIHQLNDVI